MPFDDPACFRLDRIPVRPTHRLWRPYLACGTPALLGGVHVGSAVGAEASLRPDAGAAHAGRQRDGLACAAERPSALAMVRSGLAARRRMTPMRVRPTDPRRAPCRPYGLGRRRRLPQSKATSGSIPPSNPARLLSHRRVYHHGYSSHPPALSRENHI